MPATQRQVINITSLHDGLNLRDSAASPSLSEGATVVCMGVDLTTTGVVKTATGYTTHDMGSLVPSGVTLSWIETVWMGGAKYVLSTSDTQFYVNGTAVGSVGSCPIGRFKAVALGTNIYILCRDAAYRYDGTSVYQWGITAPTDSDSPAITAGDASDKVIDDFEGALADFITNQSNCTISTEATIVKEASQSMHMAIASAVTASTWDAWASDKDFEEFDDASESFVGDIIRLWFYTTDLSQIESVKIIFDVGDGSFRTDTYSYTYNFQREVTETRQVIEQTTGIAEEEIPWAKWQQMMDQPHWSYPYAEIRTEQYESIIRAQQSDQASGEYQTVLKALMFGDDGKNMPEGVAPEKTQDVVTIRTVTPVATVGFQSNSWCAMDMPKKNFARLGTTGDWTTVAGVKIIVKTYGAVDVYFDEMSIVGGGKLAGEYYFMYGWGRTDANGNVIHYSGPARDSDGNLDIQGPITFNRQKIAWGARVASTDPQVNCCVIYISGGTLNGWWVGYVITDNDVTSGSYGVSEDDLYKPMVSLRNEPAPGGNDMLWWGNRFWIVGPDNNRASVRCSAISEDGDIMVEGFPGRNTLILGEGGGELYSIHELNGQLVVLGKLGEYSFVLSDPGDLTSIHENRPSIKNVDGKDAYVILDENLIYPAADSFIQSNGMTAKAILPGMSSVIPASSMSNARGVYRSFDGFFSFNMPTWGDTVARLDFFEGKPRIALHGQHTIDCWLYDEEKLYAIIGGTLYLFDSGYDANGAEMWMQIRSKAFTINKYAVWQYLAFHHNTGGNYFRVRAFVDEVDVGFKSFMSTTRTEEYFTFGPIKGNSFQIQFEGDYRDGGQDNRNYGEIYLPVRVYVDG